MSVWNLICHLFVTAVVLFGISTSLYSYTVGAFLWKPSENLDPVTVFVISILLGVPLTIVSLMLTRRTLEYLHLPSIVYQVVMIMAWVDLARITIVSTLCYESYGNSNSAITSSSHVLSWMGTGFGLYLYWTVG